MMSARTIRYILYVCTYTYNYYAHIIYTPYLKNIALIGLINYTRWSLSVLYAAAHSYIMQMVWRVSCQHIYIFPCSIFVYKFGCNKVFFWYYIDEGIFIKGIARATIRARDTLEYRIVIIIYYYSADNKLLIDEIYTHCAMVYIHIFLGSLLFEYIQNKV